MPFNATGVFEWLRAGMKVRLSIWPMRIRDFQANLIAVPALISSQPDARLPSDTDLAPAVERMLLARRPVIWAGSGSMFSNSSPEVIQLMELLDAAVITTQSARGIVPETDS